MSYVILRLKISLKKDAWRKCEYADACIKQK